MYYKLTLKNGAKNSLNAPPSIPEPYTYDCGHEHRTPRAEWLLTRLSPWTKGARAS